MILKRVEEKPDRVIDCVCQDAVESNILGRIRGRQVEKGIRRDE